MFSLTPEALRGRFAADDWGLSPAVNQGILELAECGLLRSVSVVPNLPFFERDFGRLLATGVEVAVHFNFTLGRPVDSRAGTLVDGQGKFYPYPAFVARGLLNQFDGAELRREAEAQLGRVAELCRPGSANGHQHVHVLPWMTIPLMAAARSFGVSRWRRMDDPTHPASWFASSLAVRRAARASSAVAWDSCHYLWPTGAWTNARIREKVARAGNRALLTHPASSDDFLEVEFSDRLRASRVDEFRCLRGLAP